MKRTITYALLVLVCFNGAAFAYPNPDPKGTEFKETSKSLVKKTITVTALSSPKSAGGKHDFSQKRTIFGLTRKIRMALTSIGMDSPSRRTN